MIILLLNSDPDSRHIPFLSSSYLEVCIPPGGLTSARADSVLVRKFVLAGILILIRYLNKFLILEVPDKTMMAMF